MDQDITAVAAAKDEPRIAFLAITAFGFDGNARLDQRAFDSIKFSQILIGPAFPGVVDGGPRS